MVLSVSIIYTGAINAQKRVVTFNSFHSDLVPRRVMTEVVKLFEQKHPDIRVDMSTTAHEDFKNAIRLWLTSNAPPDVFTWFAGERAKFFVDNRLIMDITDLWQDNKYDTLFPRAFKSLSVFNGKASFIPQSWH